MDIISEQNAFLLDVAKLINYCYNKDIKISGGELYRTQEMQELYVKEGKSRTMNSNHLKRLAIDLNVFFNGKLTYAKSDIQPLGDFWEGLNPQNRWGGNFKNILDTDHFERQVEPV